MDILVNGERRQVAGGTTVAGLLRLYQLAAPRVAVEVNERLVRRGAFEQTLLSDNDRVEIVTLVGGG
ncbi:MAG: sulfur carrier protein ThiS [Phycisphaerae bacterium]|nr:sulfur carrier protein ThiS [Phycisphaerae bacterium]NUQ48525.1 sulfur carrier protein ThiS [Phycisphaerae bacterium]